MPSGPSLYDLGAELTRAFEEIDAELQATDGEFTEAMQQRLDAAQGAWEEKAIRVALYARGLLADVKVIKAERKRLTARARGAAKYAAWLKRYLAAELKKHGRTNARGALGSVSVYAGRPSASATVDLELLDPKWVRRRIELSLDKEAILAAHAAGKKLPPGISVDRGTVVRIS